MLLTSRDRGPGTYVLVLLLVLIAAEQVEGAKLSVTSTEQPGKYIYKLRSISIEVSTAIKTNWCKHW